MPLFDSKQILSSEKKSRKSLALKLKKIKESKRQKVKRKSNINDRMVMAEIGGQLAHQVPLHNHRGGLVQPSLVMNHHLELDCHGGGGGGTELHSSKSQTELFFLV